MKSKSEVFDKVNEELFGKNETTNTTWLILGIIAILFLVIILSCIVCSCRSGSRTKVEACIDWNGRK